jgi:hypothetical protein
MHVSVANNQGKQSATAQRTVLQRKATDEARYVFAVHKLEKNEEMRRNENDNVGRDRFFFATKSCVTIQI